MHQYKQIKHHPTDDSDQDSETAIGGCLAEESADGLNQLRMVRNNPVTKLDTTGLITVDHLLDEGIPLENVQAAFQDPDLWNQIIDFMKKQYSSLTDDDFHGLTQDAKNRFGNTAPDATIKPSVEQDIFETDDDITKDLGRLFDYHQNIKIKLREESDMIFRGDTRPPEDIFEKGFTPQGKNEDLTKYVHSNEESIFVGFTTCEKIARIYAAQRETTGYVYIIKRQGNYIDVNKELMKPGKWLDETGKNLGYRFYEYAKEIVIPHGVKREEIIGCYRVNKDKKYEEN